MSVVYASKAARHRQPAVLSMIGVLAFLGFSALGGGVAMVAGGGLTPPTAWLDEIPVVDSWVVPGLVLGIGFGLGSMITAYGVLRKPRWPWLGLVERLTRHHWSWLATILIGLGHIAWITLELIYLPELSALQAVYGGVGAALLVLPMLRPVREYLRTDQR
jgi:hypothetical protein